MNYKSYIFNHNKNLCSGCGACTQVCKHNALEMQPDNEGFLYPALDSQKCIQCGLCDKICPMVSENHQENINQNHSAYLATSRNKDFGKNSATIGLCTWISLDCIKKEGIVFGVILDETDWKAKHISTNSTDMIEKMRNSKYLQSDTKQTFTEVKHLLESKKYVVYIGTPCQIAGLKSFLRKSYENLLTIDIVCHGVFSPKLVPLEVQYWENKFKGKLYNLRFRSKRIYPWNAGGIVNFDIKDSHNHIKHIERHAISSPTYYCFAYSKDGYNYNLRKCCYTCPFRGKGRYADITVGDAWGISAKYKDLFTQYNRNNGISCLLCNTEKGIKIVDSLYTQFNLYQIPKEDLFSQPAFLPTNKDIPLKRKIIYENSHMPYGELIEHLFQINLDHENSREKWKYHKKQIKSFIKNTFKLKWISKRKSNN